MALAQEDLIQIETLIKTVIKTVIAAPPEVGNANVRYELDLRDKRFDQIATETRASFEKVDKQLSKQNEAIMGRHQEIKNQMRWSFGMMIGVGGLLLGVLKIMG